MNKPDLDKLCIHTITTRPWSLEKALDEYSAEGVKGISVWQNAIEDMGAQQAGELIASYELEVVSYVRGGFFPSTSPEKRAAAISHNKQMIEEAAAVGAPLLVLVCGAEPDQSLEESRAQIESGIEHLLPFAREHKVKLGIEPLHPMYADTRSAINTLKQANDMAERLKDEYAGVVVDVYHLWWEENLKEEILRAGKQGNLLAYHICDWKYPPEDMLNDRGLMGEGCIPLQKIRGWIEEAGFKGFHEVEIFSNKYWSMDQKTFLKQIIEAYQQKS
ncbi:sugar phosphate isomerase/epimerase family protein [Moorena bouillonii]|uniref:Xylose isomerase n=1 Tax=Moorena bouillonii PNG TaxID=568701 RepID=A0A1U7NCB1_9CYAN|nr:sugar phosphate isomerase/epimerase family protein [Moorena bouillonii]OLT63588.1 xylose isomerase [Moorena bouillonii PNG]